MKATLPQPINPALSKTIWPQQIAGKRTFVGSAFLLTVVVPVVTTGSLSVAGAQLSAAIAYGILVGCGLRLAGLISAGQFRPAAFSGYTFFYVWFGLAPLAQMGSDWIPLVTPFLGWIPSETSRENTASLIALLSLVAMDVGIRSGMRSSPYSRYVWIDRTRLAVLSLGAVPAIAVGVMLLGGPLLLVSPRTSSLEVAGVGADASLAIVGIARALMRAPILVVIVAIELLRRSGQAPKVPSGVFRLMLLGVLVLIANPVVFPRFWSGAVAISLVFVLIRNSRPAVRGRVMMLVLLTGFVVLPYADTFRRGFDAEVEIESVSDQLSGDGTYSAYGQLILGVEYARLEGHTLGQQSLSSALFFVPRSVWSDKSIDTGDLIGRGTGLPDRLNPSAPLPIEGYVEFGWAGVAVVMVVLGRLLGRIDSGADVEIALGQVGRYSLLAVVVPAYLPYLLRGSLLPAIPLIAVLVFLICWISPRTASRPPITKANRGC